MRNTSRNASPIKSKSKSKSAMTLKAVMPSQGAYRFVLVCTSRAPKEGELGESPKPKKSREASVTIALDIKNGKKVKTDIMAFGIMCFTIM